MVVNDCHWTCRSGIVDSRNLVDTLVAMHTRVWLGLGMGII